MADGVRLQRIDPLQGAKGEEEHVDTLFLLQGPGVVVQVEQASLQALGGHPGLQAGVGVAGGDAMLVKLRVLGVVGHFQTGPRLSGSKQGWAPPRPGRGEPPLDRLY